MEPGEIDLVRRALALRKVGRIGVLWADDGRYYVSESEVGLYGSRRRVSLEALVVQAERQGNTETPARCEIDREYSQKRVKKACA